MNTILCYIDYPGRYSSQVNYAAETIDCEYMLAESEGSKDARTGEVFTCTLDTLLLCICRLCTRKARYRIITNNGRLAILNSDLMDRIGDGTLEYRITSGKWLSRDTGQEEDVKSCIHVASPKCSIACLEHVTTKAEVTILDTANYGIVWQERVKRHATPTDDFESAVTYHCDLSPEVEGGGLEILAYLMACYGKVCRKYRLGKPAMTTASQGMQSHYWQRGAHRWKQTTCPKALSLEIDGHFGGVQLPFGYGRYDGECHQYDISSFYPHLGTINRVPTKHVRTIESPTIYDLETLTRLSYVVARVTLQADGYYPLRGGFETLYPSGHEITTVLHQCELQRAISCDHIRAVHMAAEYECDYAFRANCEHLLSIRSQAERSGDKLTAHFAKQFAVGYWGKVGSKLSCWDDAPAVFDVDGKSAWVCSKIGSGEIESFRSLFGRVQRKRDDLVTANGSIAAAGALTAYGRERLWALVALAGKENVFYVSTDSLITNNTGHRRLMPYVQNGKFTPGMLRLVNSSDSCTIAGIGIYTIGKRSARQGFCADKASEDARRDMDGLGTYEDVIAKADSVPFKRIAYTQGDLYSGHQGQEA